MKGLEMNSEERKKLRGHVNSLTAHERLIRESKDLRWAIAPREIKPTITALEQACTDFSKITGPFDESMLHGEGGSAYRRDALVGYIGSVLGKLRAELEEEAGEGMPAMEKLNFEFIADPELRVILERDYEEAQRAYIALCWKAVTIISGGAMEAILLDALQKDQAKALAATGAPNGKDLSRWDLSSLITVAVELKIVGAGVDRLSHSVRQYRNLVHPGVELRSGLKAGKEEATIALSVFRIVHRDLAK
jgi:hypothetical protein